MDYDKDKVDEITLALLYLVMSKTSTGAKAWKVFDLQTPRLFRRHCQASSLVLVSPSIVCCSERSAPSSTLFSTANFYLGRTTHNQRRTCVRVSESSTGHDGAQNG